MTKLLRAVWERLSLYLPVLLMGLLALGTYWLVRSTPLSPAAAEASPPGHEPDYFLENFSVRTFGDLGRLNREVIGVSARHFPDTDTLEVERVRIRSFAYDGQLTTATASRAVTNGDASKVQLLGNARVIREAATTASGKGLPSLEIRGEFLDADMNQQQLTSNQPVELIRGKDRFTADRMEFDNRERVIHLGGRVKGTLMP